MKKVWNIEKNYRGDFLSLGGMILIDNSFAALAVGFSEETQYGCRILVDRPIFYALRNVKKRGAIYEAFFLNVLAC